MKQFILFTLLSISFLFSFGQTVNEPITGDGFINASEIANFSISGTGFAISSTVNFTFTDGTNTDVSYSTGSDGSGNWTLNSIDLSAFLEGVTVTVTANDGVAGIDDGTFIIDNTVPTIAIGAASVDPASNSSTVDFAITISGSTSVNLTSGDVTINNSTGTVAIIDGTTTTPTVRLTGLTGDASNVSITIASGVASDGGGNNSLAETSADFEVDNTVPTIAIGAASVDPASNSSTVDFAITISGSTSVNLTSGDVTINNSTGTVAIIDGTTTTPTVRLTGLTGDASNVSITIASGVASDDTGNDNLAETSAAFEVDNTVPTIAIGAASVDPASNSSTVDFAITISGSTSVNLTNGDVTINNSTGTVAIIDGTTTTPTVRLTGLTGDASNVSITIASGVASDGGGNNSLAETSADFEVDNTVPTIAIGAASVDPASNSSTVDFAITISGSTSVNLTSGDVTINNSTGTVAIIDGTTTTPTVRLTGLTGDASNVSITIASGVASDDTGNDNLAETSAAFEVDNTAPSAPSAPDMIAASDSGFDDTDNITNDLTPTFSGTAEANSNLEIFSDLNASLGTTSANGLGNWTFTPSTNLTSNVTHSITVLATDQVGNTSIASSDLLIQLDNLVPIVTADNITLIPLSGSPTGAGGVYIIGNQVAAEWDNSPSGNNNSDIQSVSVNFSELGGGSLAASESSDIWTRNFILPSGGIDGSNQNVFIVATDIAGNSSAPVESSANLKVDILAPSVSLLSPPDDPSNEVSTNVSLVATFDQNVIAGFGNVFLTSVQNPGGDIQTFSANDPNFVNVVDNIVTINPPQALKGEKDYYVQINNTAFYDVSGNPFSGFNSNTDWEFKTAVDNEAPVLNMSIKAPNTGTTSRTKDNKVTFILRFNEAINGISSALDISLNNTVPSTPMVELVQVSTLVYEYRVTNLTGNGEVSISVNNISGGIKDFDDNNFVGPQTSSVITIDQTRPVLVVNSFTTGNTTPTLTGTVSENLEVLVRINGAEYNAVVTGASSPYDWSATVPMIDELFEGNFLVQAFATDIAENTGNASGVVSIDKTLPVLTFSTSLSPTSQNPFTITALFSEAIIDLDASGDFIVTTGNATIGIPTATANPNEYSLTITPTIDQTAAINIRMIASGVTDNSGNAIAETNFSVLFDDQAPILAYTTLTQGRNVTLTVQQTERGKIYYAVLPEGATTTSSDLKAGGIASAIAEGNINITVANTDFIREFTLPQDRNNYELFLASEDEIGVNSSSYNLSPTPVNELLTSGGTVVSAPTLIDICLEGEYFALSNIVISETIETDFSISAITKTLRLELPTSYEFNTSVGSVSDNNGDVDIDAVGLGISYIGNTILSLTYKAETRVNLDVITISSLEVRATGSMATSNQTLLRSGGSGDIYLANDGDGTVFATLTSIAPYDMPDLVTSIPGAVTSPYVLESAGSINGDTHGDGVVVYDKGNFLSSDSPLSIGVPNATDVVNVYSDESLTAEVIAGGLTGATSYAPTLAQLNISSTSLGITTFWITVTDGESCESAATKLSVAIIRFENSEGTTAFASSNSIGTNLKFTNPIGHSAILTGNGLTSFNNDDDFTAPVEDGYSVNFIPSAAGEGISNILYALTKNGVTARYGVNFFVASTTEVILEAKVDYCQVDGTVPFTIVSPSGVNTSTDIDDANPDFQTVRAYDFRGNSRGSEITSTVFSTIPSAAPNTVNGWNFNTASLDADLVGGVYSYPVELVYIISEEGTGSETELATQIINVNRTPSVSLVNANPFYCNDDGDFDIQAQIISSLGTETLTISSYHLYKYDGVSYSIDMGEIGDANFNPADPDNDGVIYPDEEEFGRYKIVYDAPARTAANCLSSIELELEVLEIPALPLLIDTGFDGISNGDDDGYILEYCENTTVSNLIMDVSSLGTDVKVKWYNNEDATSPISSSSVMGTYNEELDVAKAFFGSNIQPSGRQSKTFYYTITDNIEIASGYAGCESETKSVTIEIYPEPSLPVVKTLVDGGAPNAYNSALDESTYVFEYCVADGDAITIEDIVLEASLNDEVFTESYYTIYDDAQNSLATFQSADALTDYTLVDSDLTSNFFTYLPTDSTELIFYISQTDFNNNYPSNLGAAFDGCIGQLREFRVKVNVIPNSPIDSDFKGGENSNSRHASVADNVMQYYLCNGESESFVQIESPGANGSLYTWYQDNGSETGPGAALTAEAFNGRLITLEELENQGVFTDLVTKDSTFIYWVTQTQSSNNSTGFDGCESDPTKVLVTVYPDPENLTFDSNSSDVLTLSICEGQVANTSFSLTGNANSTFKWYQANPAGTAIVNATPAFTQSLDLDGKVTATGLDLNISTVTQGVKYFLIAQTTNVEVNGSTFAGCESEISDMAFLTVNIYNIPTAPATADQTLFYCDTDVVADITFSGEPNAQYNWYTDNNNDGIPDGMSIYSTESAAAISTISNIDLGLDAPTKTAGIFRYLVSQISDIDEGVSGFGGCESSYTSISITIYETPSAPVVQDVAPQCDVNVTDGSTEIIYSGVETSLNTTTVFEFLDANKVSQRTIQTTLPTVSRTFVIEDLGMKVDKGFFGDTTIYITQITNIIDGEEFAGCAGDTSAITITVYQTPEMVELEAAIEHIRVIQACDGDLISLAVEVANPDPDTDYGYIWKLTQPGVSVTLPENRFNTPMVTFSAEEFAVESRITTIEVIIYDDLIGSQACPSIVTRELQIGNSPKPQFKWRGITKGRLVSFDIINQERSTDGEIEEVSLLIEDMNGNIVDEQTRNLSSSIPGDSILNDPFAYQFDEAGVYDVTVSMLSNSKCLGSVKRKVTIVDVIDVVSSTQNFITQDFESGNEEWFVDRVEYALSNGFEDRSTVSTDADYPSWQLGTSNAFDGLQGGEGLSTGSFWATNLDGAYKKNEKSWVYSPAFDLTGLELPTVSFSYATNLDLRDGVVFQFSTDDGEIWEELGSYSANTNQGSGRFWYNSTAINGDPGNFDVDPGETSYNQEQHGWTRDQGWVVAAHKLDATVSNQVRFRFALGATGSDKVNEFNEVLQGFAFDNFRIYGRDKKVIIEQFSSLNNAESISANKSLDSKSSDGGLLQNDALIINYFPRIGKETDVLSRRNVNDPGARKLYYGVSAVPRSVISGVVQDKIIINPDGTSVDPLGWSDDKFNSIALEAKQFDIEAFVFTGKENEIKVEVTFKSLIDVTDPNLELSFRFAIVEDIAVSDLENQLTAPLTGINTLRNVLRRMLPSSGGFTKVGSVKLGDEITHEVLWSIRDVYDPSKLKVIAFVQVDASISASVRKGSILQAREQAVPAGKVLTTAENITAAKDQIHQKVVVFPNPANKTFEVSLDQRAAEDLKWVLFDQTGRELASGHIPKGGSKASIDTKALPNGLFMLHLFGDESKWLPQRVMITH